MPRYEEALDALLMRYNLESHRHDSILSRMSYIMVAQEVAIQRLELLHDKHHGNDPIWRNDGRQENEAVRKEG